MERTNSILNLYSSKYIENLMSKGNYKSSANYGITLLLLLSCTIQIHRLKMLLMDKPRVLETGAISKLAASIQLPEGGKVCHILLRRKIRVKKLTEDQQ